MRKPIYRTKDNWVLGQCLECGRLNYVEPHGVTAHCKCKPEETEHRNIPHEYRDESGFYLVKSLRPSDLARARAAGLV